MLVLSAGMMKAGTGWIFNMTNDLLVEAGNPGVRELKERHDLGGILRFDNCNIDKHFTEETFRMLTAPPLGSHTYVVKTHLPPRKFVAKLIGEGLLKVTYAFRDPRDVALSAFEHGQRGRKRGETSYFSQLTKMEGAIRLAGQLIEGWRQWSSVPGVLTIRYEDMLVDPVAEMRRVSDYLGLSIGPDRVGEIVASWDTGKIEKEQKWMLHYNVGEAGRFREAMSDEDIRLCDEILAPHLPDMGYPV